MPYCYFKEEIETSYNFETHFFFSFVMIVTSLLDQRFREASPSALPFLSGVKMSCNCFLTRSFFM